MSPQVLSSQRLQKYEQMQRGGGRGGGGEGGREQQGVNSLFF